MGKKHVRFQCHSCIHCCTDVVCLPTPWDVVRIVRETGAAPHKFLEFIRPDEISEVEEDDPTWLEVNEDRFLMALRRGKKGCHFLNKKTKKCKIYESRPLLCRLYPFSLHQHEDGSFKKFTLHKDVGCPKNRDGKMPTGPLWALCEEDEKHQTDYNDLVAVFNERDYEGKEPEDFVGMFVETAPAGGKKKGVKKKIRKED